MALSHTAMAALIKSNIDAILPAGSAACNTAYLEAFCKGIVDHIKAAAVVPAGITCSVDPGTHTGATTGAGTVQ